MGRLLRSGRQNRGGHRLAGALAEAGSQHGKTFGVRQLVAAFLHFRWMRRAGLPQSDWSRSAEQESGDKSPHSITQTGSVHRFAGVFKSLFFGAAIALIGCHRGFHCDPGAEGVGRAATTAFVYSFIMILLLDLLLGIMLDGIYYALWPGGPTIVG